MEVKKIISLDPSRNYKIIGEVTISTYDEINYKIRQARLAQKTWSSLDISKRLIFLEKLYQEFEKRKDDIKTMISKEIGKPYTLANLTDIEGGLKYMRGYLNFAQKWLEPKITFENEKEIHYLFFEPKGVVGISIPWNYPFLLFIWAVVQNLIVGNTVVVKHSKECVLTGKLLEEIVNSVNLPEGVFNEVYGNGSDTGEYLMNSDIDLIWFTGSSIVGKHLYQVASKKFIPAILELGGSAPGIVFKDANLEMTIKSIYFNRFSNSGQSCDALKRLIVHKDIFDDVIKQLKDLILTKTIGYPDDPKTDLGPLVSKKQVTILENQVNDAIEKGAKVIIGAKQPLNLQGAYYEPTLLTNISFDMAVWQEETFGPVLPIVPFKDENEAIALANDTKYGLGGYIYTQDKERAINISKLIKTGNVSINNANYSIFEDPFGGYKYSGLGREHSKIGLQELCNLKVIALNK